MSNPVARADPTRMIRPARTGMAPGFVSGNQRPFAKPRRTPTVLPHLLRSDKPTQPMRRSERWQEEQERRRRNRALYGDDYDDVPKADASVIRIDPFTHRAHEGDRVTLEALDETAAGHRWRARTRIGTSDRFEEREWPEGTRAIADEPVADTRYEVEYEVVVPDDLGGRTTRFEWRRFYAEVRVAPSRERPPQTSLAVTLDAVESVVHAGQSVRFVATVTNVGETTAARDVHVRQRESADALFDGAATRRANVAEGWPDAAHWRFDGDEATFTVGDLAPGEQRCVWFCVRPPRNFRGAVRLPATEVESVDDVMSPVVAGEGARAVCRVIDAPSARPAGALWPVTVRLQTEEEFAEPGGAPVLFMVTVRADDGVPLERASEIAVHFSADAWTFDEAANDGRWHVEHHDAVDDDDALAWACVRTRVARLSHDDGYSLPLQLCLAQSVDTLAARVYATVTVRGDGSNDASLDVLPPGVRPTNGRRSVARPRQLDLPVSRHGGRPELIVTHRFVEYLNETRRLRFQIAVQNPSQLRAEAVIVATRVAPGTVCMRRENTGWLCLQNREPAVPGDWLQRSIGRVKPGATETFSIDYRLTVDERSSLNALLFRVEARSDGQVVGACDTTLSLHDGDNAASGAEQVLAPTLLGGRRG